MSFDLNPELSQAIHRLQEVIIQDDDEYSELAGMVDISKVSVYLIFNDLFSDVLATVYVQNWVTVYFNPRQT